MINVSRHKLLNGRMLCNSVVHETSKHGQLVVTLNNFELTVANRETTWQNTNSEFRFQYLHKRKRFPSIAFNCLPYTTKRLKPVSGRVDRASSPKTVDSGSIPGWAKLTTTITGIYSSPAGRSAIKGRMGTSTLCGGQVRSRQLDSKTFAVSWPWKLSE